MPDLLTQQVDASTKTQVKEIIESIKSKRDGRKKVVNNIKSAKKDLTDLLSMADDIFSEITDALGDDAPDWLKDTSDFLKDSTDILEKTSILVGMTKSATVSFWLALVQVLVDEAETSINKQMKSLDGILDILTKFEQSINKIKRLLSGASNPDALNFAYKHVVMARDDLMGAKKVYTANGTVILRFTDSAVNHLEIAEKRLMKDIDEFNEIPSLQQFRELSTFIMAMYPSLLALYGDYAIECANMYILIKQVRNIDKAVRDNVDLIDRELTLKMLDKMISNIEKKTEKPLGEVLKSWKSNSPSQSSILWNELTYMATIQSNYRKIKSYFGKDFTNLSKLEIASGEYKKLVDSLNAEKYVLGAAKDNPETVKSVAVKIGAPSLNVFSLGDKSATAMEAMVKKNRDVINDLRDGALRTLTLLSSYGPYKSQFLDYLNNSLKLLGYEGEPIKEFATGNLINLPKFSGNVPEVRGVVSPGSDITSGIAFYLGKAFGTSVEEKAVSDAINKAIESENKRRKKKNEKQKRNIEQVMDDVIAENEKVIAQLDEEIEVLEYGIDGKLPEFWYDDNLENLV